MTDPVFRPGQVVICQTNQGAKNYLTVGKSYTVVEYAPPTRMKNGFVFPAYVAVGTDYGKVEKFRTYRFRLKEQT